MGDGGRDTLHGGLGEDILYGGAGQDRLQGGEDSDELHGDVSPDEFIFRAGDGVDFITDFNLDEDKIIFLAQTEEQATASQGDMFLSYVNLNMEYSKDAGGVVITSDNFPNGIIVEDVAVEQLTVDLDPNENIIRLITVAAVAVGNPRLKSKVAA